MTIPIISFEHVDSVCRMGQGADCCKYLIASPQGLECAKSPGNEEFREAIEARTDMVAQSDNCNGFRFPYLVAL